MLENQMTEFKREYNQKAQNTMLAFLNTDGGTLYIGIEDDGSILGVDGDIDLLTRRIASSFRDSVTPDPSGYFKVDVETCDGKRIVVVSVERGMAIPYCYAAYGLVPQGVYVRVGSHTVTATREHIRQMIKDNGTGQFIAELSIDQNLTFDYAEKTFAEREVKFGQTQRQTLGLIRADGRYTNLALVLSDQCPYTTKAAIFEGLNKEKFKDRKEFTGSLFKQIGDVHAYLTVNNHIRSTFEGIYRIDHPDYPDILIREAFINALIHRDYYIEGSILISIFDDRIEFTSLGGLMPGVTHDLMLKGISVSRNEKLAQVFHRLNIIDAFGTGIPRIFSAYEDSDAKPKIPIVDGGFLLEAPNRNYYAATSGGIGSAVLTSEQQILSVFSEGSFNKEEAAGVLGISVSGAYKLLQRMVEQGLLKAKKQGRQWIYSQLATRNAPIAVTDYLDRKIVTFSGVFDGGSLRLKDLVYFAGGAPTENVPEFIHYIVVGRGGQDTQAYKKALPMIRSGSALELTAEGLVSICRGEKPVPELRTGPMSDITMIEATDEGVRSLEQAKEKVFRNKRSAFARRYGILQPDGSRI